MPKAYLSVKPSLFEIFMISNTRIGAQNQLGRQLDTKGVQS